MTSRDLCYWLQGFFEINGQTRQGLTAPQTEMVQRHLALVFKHEIDPSFPAEQQAALNQIHSGAIPFAQQPEGPPPGVLVRY